MKIDNIEDWVKELHKQHFDISGMAWRLLRLAGQYQNIVIRPKENSILEVIVNSEPPRTYSFEDAIGSVLGKFRMILGRIASFYMESRLVDTGLYGFEGEMEVEDNFGCNRTLAIEMKNNGKDGFYLFIKVITGNDP